MTTPIQRALLGAALGAGLLHVPAAAQSNPACNAAAHRQFDFWIGHWDLFNPAGKKVGENRIEPHGNGCFLLESWSGAGGVTGKSLNMYDAGDQQWHQAWMDSSGSRLLLDGGLDGKSMVMGSSGPDPAKPGATLMQRIRWTPNEDGSVRQLWESSRDGGASWGVAFDGRYVKRKPTQP